MDLLNATQVAGNVVEMLRTNPLHMDSNGRTGSLTGASTESGFGQLVMNALNETNSMQTGSENMMQQLIVDPESVDVHDVTIAMAEANMALSVTKAVLDRAIRAYREIMSTQ